MVDTMIHKIISIVRIIVSQNDTQNNFFILQITQ